MRHFKYLFKYLFLFLMILMIAALLCDKYVFVALAQTTEKVPEAPKTLKEAETIGKDILKGFPQALKKPWQEALVIGGKMADWFKKNLWDSYIYPWLQNIWSKISSFLGKEVEKRKPEIQEEFEKEKQEMREEVFMGTKTLWQRFKELID